MNRSISILFVAACTVVLVTALFGSSSWAQHGGHGGGHGGGGHGGGGHGGGGHGGGGHGGGGHGGGGHGGGGHGIGHGIGHGVGLGIGHGGGHYGGYHGYSTHFDFHVYPWYAGVGFGRYDAPYYTSYAPVVVQPVTTVVQQPVVASQTVPELAASTTTAEGLNFQRRAEQAFRSGRYNEAARRAHHALVEMPRDGKLYLFTSQALFAIGDYQGAAATIHQGVSLLEPKDWGYIVENYQSYYRGRDFVTQMDRLTEFTKQKPEAAFAHFVRGYQHGYVGNKKTAIKELTLAVELESRDQLASQLLEQFGGTPPMAAKPAEALPEGEKSDETAP